MFNPNRLSLAKKRRRLSLKGFAELTGLHPATISRLEKGKHQPDDETVKIISEKLNFPIPFFYGEDIDELLPTAASFRSLTSITAKERDAALAAGSLAYTLSDWVHSRFDLPVSAIPDLGHERDAETAAIQLRQEWGLGQQPISNMIKLLESKGVRVFSLAENTKNVDAFSCWRNQIPYVFLNTFKSAEHSRFDAAHELAHLCIHKHGGTKDNKSAEAEANSFASAFLMPADDVRSRLPYVVNIEQLIASKKRWGVSVAALIYRLRKLNLLSDWQYHNFYVQITKRGYRTQEPHPLPREVSTIWDKVFKQLWSERITKNHIADQLHIPFEEIANLVFNLDGSAAPHRSEILADKGLTLVE